MVIQHKIQRFPGVAFVLMLGLTAALVAVMILSVGGWGLSIGGPHTPSTTATQTLTGTAPTEASQIPSGL